MSKCETGAVPSLHGAALPKAKLRVLQPACFLQKDEQRQNGNMRMAQSK